MAATVRISCPAGSYTALNTAGISNLAFNFNARDGRMVIAMSLPAASETNYVTVREAHNGWAAELGSLGGSDVVYLMPSDACTAEVIRG